MQPEVGLWDGDWIMEILYNQRVHPLTCFRGMNIGRWGLEGGSGSLRAWPGRTWLPSILLSLSCLCTRIETQRKSRYWPSELWEEPGCTRSKKMSGKPQDHDAFEHPRQALVPKGAQNKG